jgi:type II secretory pathway pseudopilin PulG
MNGRIVSCLHRPERSGAAGFTLVELMVALTGGLFVSLAVFALARDSGRFYQRESRVANATVGALLGFERLRTDIARAAFLSSPNAVRDIGVCSKPAANWPTALRSLASIQITQPATTGGALGANGRNPPSLLLSGSYTSVDQFPARARAPAGPTVTFDIEPSSSALLRLGNGVLPSNTTMQTLFATGRALRFVQAGKQYYGSIVGATGGAAPTVTINSAPPLQMRSGGANSCGVEPIIPSTLNVVNFIQYSVRNLSTNALTAQGQADYASLYANSAAGPGEAQRTELVRVEEAVDGTPMTGTEEVVAEYAVDLGFQITAVTGTGITGNDPTLGVVLPTAGAFSTYTGDVFNTANTPELVRTLRVRLGVRSRESDRAAGLTADVGAGQTQGLYRFNVGSGAEPFARVRTFQADVALSNQMDVLW